MHIGVSGGGAPLASPGRRAPDDFLGSVREVGGRVYERGVLSPQLKKDGGQIFCSRLHDDLPHHDASGEEDEVKRQLEKLRNFFFASRDRSDGTRIEVLRNEIQQEFTCRGQTLGELQNAGITCRNNRFLSEKCNSAQ